MSTQPIDTDGTVVRVQAQQMPGPWTVDHTIAFYGPDRWYAERMNNGRKERLSNANGNWIRFDTKADAEAAIAKATGSAP